MHSKTSGFFSKIPLENLHRMWATITKQVPKYQKSEAEGFVLSNKKKKCVHVGPCERQKAQWEN